MPDPTEPSTLAAEALEIARALLRDALGGRPPFPPSIEAVARALDDFRAAGVAAERERKAIIADEYARNAAEDAQMYTEENMQAVITVVDEEGRRFVRERWWRKQHYLHGRRHCAVEIAAAIRAQPTGGDKL